MDNNFLSLVMKEIRSKRPLLSIDEVYYMRIEKAKVGRSATLWFMTNGCSWDALGGCTMCNHGRGHNLDEKETISAVLQGLAALPPDIAELFFLASGSLLDPLEVPPAIRREIYKLISKQPVGYLGIETRAEHVNEPELNLIKENLGAKNIGIEIGLESANLFIRRFCVNKGNSLNDFIAAASLVNKYQFECLANVALGNAFLTHNEALEDAVRSTHWALDNGANTVVLFPIHVKPYTLLEWLYKKGYYKLPTLWLFIETLYRIGPERIGQVDISWYKSGYSDTSKIVISPDSCEKCKPAIYLLLDEFRQKRSFDVICLLYNMDCSCKSHLQESANTALPLNERVFEMYSVLAEDFGLTDWFNINKTSIKKTMEAALCHPYN